MTKPRQLVSRRVSFRLSRFSDFDLQHVFNGQKDCRSPFMEQVMVLHTRIMYFPIFLHSERIESSRSVDFRYRDVQPRAISIIENSERYFSCSTTPCRIGKRLRLSASFGKVLN